MMLCLTVDLFFSFDQSKKPYNGAIRVASVMVMRDCYFKTGCLDPERFLAFGLGLDAGYIPTTRS
jgi:hypothetical protein